MRVYFTNEYGFLDSYLFYFQEIYFSCGLSNYRKITINLFVLLSFVL